MIHLSNSVSYSTIFTHDHLCISISFWTDDNISPLEEATIHAVCAPLYNSLYVNIAELGP
jgi:hypothetical protein